MVAIGDWSRIYNYIDCYHVGIIEGLIRVLGHTPKIVLQLDSRIESEFVVDW